MSSTTKTSNNIILSMDQKQQILSQTQQQEALNCPRCESSNTKFCYYNNYNLSQPRHFCKACKRYWTRGGTLRNVPVGGGCRKNKRTKRGSTTSSTTSNGTLTTSTTKNPSGTNFNSNTTHGQSSSNQLNPNLFYGLHNINISTNPNEVNNLRNTLFSYGSFTSNPSISSLYNDLIGTTTTTTRTTTTTSVTTPTAGLNPPGIHPEQNYINPTLENLLGVRVPLHLLEHDEYFGNLTALPYETHEGVGVALDHNKRHQVKLDLDNNVGLLGHHQQIINGLSSSSSDLSSPLNYWSNSTAINSNANGVGSNWLDPSNIGSSLTSLI